MNSKNWFEKMWGLEDFLILDTETTGLNKRDEVVQIGIIDKSGAVLFDRLICPKTTVSPGAAGVHGITDDMLIDAPTISDVFGELHNLIEGKSVFVYNAPFDERMIAQSCVAWSLDNLARYCFWNDVMKPYARFYSAGGRWQSLTNACAQQDVEIVDAHSAVGDCQMTLALMKKLAS